MAVAATPRSRGGIRIPIQTGASAIGGSVVGMSICIIAWSAGISLVFGGHVSGLLFSALSCAILLGLSVPAVWQWRAADLLMFPTHLEIRGCPHHGMRIDWSEIDPMRTLIRRDEEPMANGNGSSPVYATKLYVGLRQGDELVVATVVDGGKDHAPLQAVLDVLLARTGAPPPQDTLPSAPPDVVICSACGGAAVPASRATVACT